MTRKYTMVLDTHLIRSLALSLHERMEQSDQCLHFSPKQLTMVYLAVAIGYVLQAAVPKEEREQVMDDLKKHMQGGIDLADSDDAAFKSLTDEQRAKLTEKFGREL